MSLGGGYQEPTGVYFSETEPMRFLRLINFANSNVPSTAALLGFPTGLTNTQLSLSALRFQYYHYDEWQSKIASLGGNVASGLLDWMRSEPFYWYYYDIGASGNFTRRVIKSVSFPYDDITQIPVGDNPLNYNFPLIQSSGARLRDDTSLLLPFYQSAGLIEQVQTAYANMFDNPIKNSVHLADVNVSGVPVPQIPRTVALQLNNLNIAPTGFISEYGIPKLDSSGNIIFPLNISPGSGFQPILDMAQQINYPKEYISNLSAILPCYPGGSTPPTDCNNYGFIYRSFTEADIWRSKIYFGFMVPSSINIQLNCNFPTYNKTGVEIDRFGNQRQTVNAVIYPTISTSLYSSSSLDAAYPVGNIGDNLIQTLTSANTSGVNNLSIIYSGAGYNSFSRYYDPLGDANSNNLDSQNVNTTNYYLDTRTGWQITYSGGNECLHTSNIYFSGIPNLTIDPSNISLTINNVIVPTSKYPSGLINAPLISAVNSPDQVCYPILTGSTITVFYRIPAINCRGYRYGIDKAISNPGPTSFQCRQWNGQQLVNTCISNNFYSAGIFGFCCSDGFQYSCTNVYDPAAAFQGFCNRPKPADVLCYVGFVPHAPLFQIINKCGDGLFSASLPGSLPPSGTYNVWTEVSLSGVYNVSNQYLNQWQHLSGLLTLTTEKECIDLTLDAGGGYYNGCFKDPGNGQQIETHVPPPHCQVTPLASNDLAINLMTTNNVACSGGVQCDPNSIARTCLQISNSAVSTGGMTVFIDSVKCHFLVQCPDGTTSTLDFTLPGGSLNYLPEPDFGCGTVDPVVTGGFDMGKAPSVCGSWW